MSDTAPWRLQDHVATHESNGQVSLDVFRPDRGLRGSVAGLDFQSVLALHFPLSAAPDVQPADEEPADEEPADEEPEDCYLRGDDLVIQYPPLAPAHEIRPHVYWRADRSNRDDVLLRVDLILSIQTHLLHSRARTVVSSTLGPGACLRRSPDGAVTEIDRSAQLSGVEAPSLWLHRPRDSDVSFAQILHPADLFEAEARVENEGARFSHVLFPDPMEKGVIRRARLCAAWLRRQRDVEQAIAILKSLMVNAPPLST